MQATFLVGYLLLFLGAAVAVVLGGLLVGRLLRPHHPTPEKLQTYECGEPAVGPADVQFDLRFYVVALVFLIFDVEVAVFFPWAVVFGKATHLRSMATSEAAMQRRLTELGWEQLSRPKAAQGTFQSRERSEAVPMGDAESPRTAGNFGDQGEAQVLATAANTLDVTAVRAFGTKLAWMACVDILVFFALLLVGFAYVWYRGDLTWVRSLPAEVGSGAAKSSALLEEGLSEDAAVLRS